MKFHFTCGCILDQVESKTYTYKTGKKYSRRWCPNHRRGRVMYTVTDCPDCGVLFKIAARGLAVRCADCQREHHLARMRMNTKKYYYPHRKRREKGPILPGMLEEHGDPERWNCAWRSACLDRYMSQSDIITLPCRDCHKYSIGSGGFDALDQRRDYTFEKGAIV